MSKQIRRNAQHSEYQVSPPISSPKSSSSSPSSSSDGSSSSSELNPSDALQSPLTGLLNFEGFSMPQMGTFGISNIDMPNLPNFRSLPRLRAFNMPKIQQRLPDLANISNNLTNLQNFPNLPNLPNLPSLSQFTGANTPAELQNLFNLFRISGNLPNLPTLPNLPNLPGLPGLPGLPNLPNLPNLPALPHLPPFFSAGLFSRGQLIKPWAHLRDSVRNMHRRLSDITQHHPKNLHFKEWRSNDGSSFIRIYFLLNHFIYYCDSPVDEQPNQQSNHGLFNNFHANHPTPSTSSGSNKHHHNSRHHNRNHSHHHSNSNRSESNSSNKHEYVNLKTLHPTNLLVDGFVPVDTFLYDPINSRFVFAVDKNLYYLEDCPGRDLAPHVPIKIETNHPWLKSDLLICPSNPDIISYYCNGDLWCVNLRNHHEIKMTSNQSQIRRNIGPETDESISGLQSNDAISSAENKFPSQHCNPHGCCPHSCNSGFDAQWHLRGRPCHVIREEFKRQQGYWWRPDMESTIRVGSPETVSEHMLIYEETDQSKVGIVNISSWDGKIEGQRFPRAGALNPVSKLKLIKFKVSNHDNMIRDIEVSDVVANFKDIYPDYEYLVRAGWLDSDVIWFQLLNRRQTHLVLAAVSLSDSFEPQIIYEERNNNYWIATHDILYFLNASKAHCSPLVKGSTVKFIWASEETGFRHLYLIKVAIGDKEIPSRLIAKRQLTDGQWEINEKDLWVDEDEMLVYFCGLRDTPLEKHLYVLSYADYPSEGRHGSSHSRIKLHRLSELNFSQSIIAFNEKRSIFVNIQSNVSVPPFGFVNLITPHTRFRRDHRRLPDRKRIALLMVNSLNYPLVETSHLEHPKAIGLRPSILYDCQADLLPGLAKPELFCCQLASGEFIYGSVFKPEFMESGVRYPTVLEVYGGPEVQMVSNDFMKLRHSGRHLLSSEGYVVVVIDCRGSGKRGLTFEAHSQRRMGQVEIADQVEVLKWLATNTGYIDMTRLAIKGWSYGGYLSLMALAQYPKIFKVAIAGAPVTDWLLYDTAYTERFMGLPGENLDGYFKGNVLNYVHLFPDQGNRLLILHGLMDENVHFAHSTSLIKALIEAGKPYDLQVFPVERHILENPMSCENYMTCVLSYLQLNL